VVNAQNKEDGDYFEKGKNHEGENSLPTPWLKRNTSNEIWATEKFAEEQLEYVE
jgi:hypothetical protein